MPSEEHPFDEEIILNKNKNKEGLSTFLEGIYLLLLLAPLSLRLGVLTLPAKVRAAGALNAQLKRRETIFFFEI